MSPSIEIVCCRPERRDALCEAARLALSFLEVSTRPGRRSMLPNPGERLRVYIGPAALRECIPTGETVLVLLRALQKYGVPVYRSAASEDGDPPADRLAWWDELEPGEPGEPPDALRLEIV